MDHEATREQLELAAVEPGGLDRLMAGDTATAQAVAAHLAGCPSCSDELVRLQRVAALIREAVREIPSPDLRARTLATVRAEGVQRPLPVAVVPTVPAATSTSDEVPVAPSESVAPAGPVGRRWTVIGWVGTIAAAIVLSVVTTSLIVGSRVDDKLAAQAATIDGLEAVTTATLKITAEPDAERVALTGVSDPSVIGSLAFSPSTTELVVVATGLARPPAGFEYRCWVQAGGQRQRVGKMYFGDDLAYWAGSSPVVSGLSGAATFGVSLVGISGSAVDTEPVLVGQL